MRKSALRFSACILGVGCFVLGATGPVRAQEYSRGAVLPDVDKLRARVDAQNVIAKRTEILMGAVRGETPAPGALNACDVHAKRFSWQDQKVVTAIEDQGQCGSCWAFATVAAYEASYLIGSHQTTDINNSPVNDLSEQEVLDCTTPASPTTNSCSGGWHDDALAFIKNSGEIDIGKYGSGKYQGQKAAACKIVPSTKMPYQIENWGYIGNGTIPTDDDIKTALCQYGPVVTAVNSAGWDDYAKSKSLWAKFQSNHYVLEGNPKPSKAVTWANIVKGDIDHEVIIVGWDNDLNAWIIKNSWGPGWGMDGFMLLERGTANVGFNAAWVTAQTVQLTAADANKVSTNLKTLVQQKAILVQQELTFLKTLKLK